MQVRGNERLFSATDLVGFLDCEYLTELNLRALGDPDVAKRRVGQDASAALIAARGDQHEREHFEQLGKQERRVVDLSRVEGTPEERYAQTIRAMQEGADVIYQATLLQGNLIGHADFLRRVDGLPSQFGPWSYEVADTKLARSPKAKFLVQLAFYCRLLAVAQARAPEFMHVVLGDKTEVSYRCADYAHYFDALLERFEGRISALDSGAAPSIYPIPTEHCGLCDWRDYCDEKRLNDDHLCQVAGITRVQTVKLQEAGISTMRALAALPANVAVPRMQAETLTKLREQAALQEEFRRTGVRRVVVLPRDPLGRRGFYRVPVPDEGDVFFDMEGDPLEDGGLEYLFGVWFAENGKWEYRSFWAHDRQQERIAFEEVVDFIAERRARFPGAHVYHYASYEESALKRLACLHATREQEVDDLLRQGALVDLYKVVREGIRISEPGYSIKNVERFYRPAREGDVKDAGASLVYYERWRETGEREALTAIESYNRVDTESTQQLREWLLALRPPEAPWFTGERTDDAEAEGATATAFVREIEERLAAYRARLLDPQPTDRASWHTTDHVSELTYQLLDFHRRAAKPAWWAMYARMDMSEEELLEDPECLGGLVLDRENPPTKVKRSTVYTFIAPEQESKLLDGDSCTRCDTGEALGRVSFDEDARRVRLTVGPSKQPLPDRVSIGPGMPIKTAVITEGIFRFADSWLAQDHRYAAIEDLLARRPPRLLGRPAGQPIADDVDQLAGSIAAVQALDRSYLYLQGPPGAGKTYTGARIIAALLAAGKTVGVMSNSHKAINLLMTEGINVALEQGAPVRAMKKATNGNEETELHVPGIVVANVYENGDVWGSDANLIGGTAWLFSHEDGDQMLDYLFVDEAGQVALANLVGAGTCARNLVLLGDQMQLGQPVQGVHPGHSGDSSLDFLLDGAATIASNRGVFLKTSWRMHPDVCRFISEAVYDGRLRAEPSNARRVLVLNADAHPLLRPSGVVHAPIEHEGCSQRSEEEAQLIAQVYGSALQQRSVDRQGNVCTMTPENILVVAPYNLQVNLLKRTLPAGARVGTVDKFQGQEAELVIVSMTTSSEEDLPRYIEFLYSKNRLNVAVSRAKCLAIVVANPKLMAIKCRTPEQMALVNTLCWMAAFGKR